MLFKKPYSKREKPAPDSLSYEIPPHVRSRIIQLFGYFAQRTEWLDVQQTLEDAGQRALLEYGGLYRSNSPVIVSGRSRAEEIVEHFENCPDDRALDFLEWCFQSQGFRAAQCVDGVNEIFRDEGIGYEFTPWVVHSQEFGNGSIRSTIDYPEVIKKSNELIHSTTIVPTLQLLSSKTFATANREMLEAHQHFRHGEHTAAINSAGQALETVLKTICEEKGWPYQPDKDTLGRLLQTVQQRGLISDLDANSIQRSSGDIRNRLGAHGKGPNPTFATAEQAENMIQVTSAHILLLARNAKL